MILYLDSSALAKRYLSEEGSYDVEQLVAGAELVATSVITRVEVSAALARARRQKLLGAGPAARLRTLFASHWGSMLRLNLLESTVERADSLAWELDLRGYNAVHLASAMAWREAIAEAPVLATYDKELWRAAQVVEMGVWPLDLQP